MTSSSYQHVRALAATTLLLLTAEAVSAQNRVIFSAGQSDGFYLNPILQVSRVGGSTRWQGIDRSINGPYLAVGRKYPTQLGLQPGPRLAITKVLHEAFGCDETETFMGLAEPEMPGAYPGSGIAGDVPGLLRPSRGLRAPRSIEIVILRDSVTGILRRLGIPPAALDSVEWLQTVADSLPDGTVILGAAWSLLNPLRWSGESVERSLDRFAGGVVVLERRRGRWHIAYDSHRSDSEVEFRRTEIEAVADLDGDGIQEILLGNHYYESWNYTLLARRTGKWIEVWESEIDGC